MYKMHLILSGIVEKTAVVNHIPGIGECIRLTNRNLKVTKIIWNLDTVGKYTNDSNVFIHLEDENGEKFGDKEELNALKDRYETLRDGFDWLYFLAEQDENFDPPEWLEIIKSMDE